MKLRADGVALIKSQEACRLEAYRCPAGAWTIGYGHTGPEVHEGLTIDQAEADAILAADLLRYDALVQKVCPQATAGEHAAMVSLCFNIGGAAFTRSSVARLHNAGRIAEAGQAFALWNKANGRVLSGLVARRAAEATLYLSDTSPVMTPPTSIRAMGERPLQESRSLAGAAVSGTAIATVASGEVVHQFSDLQAALTDLVPYFADIRWALLAITLAGLGLSAYARWRDRQEGRN